MRFSLEVKVWMVEGSMTVLSHRDPAGLGGTSVARPPSIEVPRLSRAAVLAITGVEARTVMAAVRGRRKA